MEVDVTGIDPTTEIEDVSLDSVPEETEQELTPLEELAVILQDFSDAPDITTLNMWSERFDNIFSSSVSSDDIFIWRTVNRSEYKKILSTIAPENAGHLEDAIVRKCLLYPTATVEFFSGSRAGLIPTLFEQMMFKSGFIPKELALSMVRKL